MVLKSNNLHLLVFSTLITGSLLMGCQPNHESHELVEVDHIDNHHDQQTDHHTDNHTDIQADHHLNNHTNNHIEPEQHEHPHEAHDHENHHMHTESNEKNEHYEDNHSAHDHDHDIHRLNYTCKPSQIIGVVYHKDDTPPTAHLLIEGIEYDMGLTNSNDKIETYSSEYGFDEDHSLIWQVNPSANKASLYEVYKTENISLEDTKPLYDCQMKS